MVVFYLVIKIDVKRMKVFTFEFKYEIQSTNLHTEYCVNNRQITQA